ncbi:serine/threonine-protein kinase [Streptomyces orinoci]|uniref:non-specific serine/threonine protein kinase n=1 Tax=Streptomyces orinoci TaxID=67339 RepID=A0ABV3JU12_STRON|nr:serine/threonine-protein kinase [Streptomyces orinoci]
MGSFAAEGGAQDGPVAGRYRLGRRIGRGGMGTVWQATDELLGREVAVKELHTEDRDLTLREARTVALVKHPNVMVLHDIVEQDGRPWIVMELIDGRSLSDLLAARGPVGPREAARIGVALLGALRAAHARGVLHRDIKPANVLIESGTGRVVLTDFGIARVPGATTLTGTGAFVGSPEYTAPERMSGGQAGPESDLWSLGVLLCAALSGESPFHRDSLGGILHAVVYDEIRPPDSAGPLLPVVRGLLERDPARRMGADEAERLLNGYLETGRTPAASVHYTPTQRSVPTPVPPAATATPPPPPGKRPSRARTALLAGLALIVLAGAGAAVAVTLLEREGGGADAKSAPRNGSSAGATVSASQSPPQAPATATVNAPPGFHAVQDPAGFALAVPDGCTRSFEPPRVFYYSPGKEFRIGILIQDPQEGGPAGAMRNSATQAPDRYPGYRDGKVARSRHRGGDAATWEFTWDGFEKSEGPRHTYDLSWNEADKMYDIWVSGPEAKSAEAQRYFRTALDTFARIRPSSGR